MLKRPLWLCRPSAVGCTGSRLPRLWWPVRSCKSEAADASTATRAVVMAVVVISVVV